MARNQAARPLAYRALIIIHNIVDVVGVTKTYGKQTALRDLDFEIRPGEIHALIGLNGAGKSTLMKILMGMVTQDCGDVRIFGKLLAHIGSSQWQRVGHMIESPPTYPELTVAENLRLSATLRLVPREALPTRIDVLIKRLAIEPWREHKTMQLSLGNKQRLALGCALAADP